MTTDRLIIRRLKQSDGNNLHQLRSDPALMRFIPRPLTTCVEDAVRLIQVFNDAIRRNESITWGITLQDQPGVIGTIGFVRINPENFRAEVGYLLHPDYQGLGIMQEALQAVVDYGFGAMRLHSIVAIVDPGNTASARVLERSGFRKEGHFREDKYFNGRFLDSVYYARLASEL
ncbi:GNAT family N-acetyltransferase [Larkinella insperata]|uniref:GNAT family N-acetyltransferase n=1 Tax=Larkinella insperata TaxID=332158 RepID=A0ABW3Q3Z7_9BACT